MHRLLLRGGDAFVALSCGERATPDDRATSLYRSAVRSFIESAVRFGRFNRRKAWCWRAARLVPVTYQGFVWQPDDFCTFLPVGSYESPRLSNRYVTRGVGVPYVVLSTNPPRHPFTNIAQPFAATAVVAPSGPAGGGFALQFYDPLRADATDGRTSRLRAISRRRSRMRRRRRPTAGWMTSCIPAATMRSTVLHMHEPFQPGKIPVVFVHGLASDPLTWAQLENDLRAQPAIFNRYQFWFFRYDTGDPFLSECRPVCGSSWLRCGKRTTRRGAIRTCRGWC